MFKFLKRIFSRSRNNENRAQKSALPNQYISAKDQKRAKEFDNIANIEVTKQQLEAIKPNKELSTNTADAIEKEAFRYEAITALHEAYYEGFSINEQQMKDSIESFAKSNFSIEEIKWHLEQFRWHLEHVRELENKNKTIHHQGTKLPQKSLPDESYIY